MGKSISKLKDRDWLKEQYSTNKRSLQDIADEIGCSKSAVGRALNRLKINKRKRTSKYEKLNNRDWLYQKYVEEEMSLNDIADLVGSTPGNVGSHLYSKGIETRSESEAYKVKFPEGRSGSNHPNWRGGIRTTGNGYIYVYAPEHPYATKTGYVMEHRLVVENELGRYLESHEDVHHINEDKKDNRPENLIPVNRSEHKKIHGNQGDLSVLNGFISDGQGTIEYLKFRQILEDVVQFLEEFISGNKKRDFVNDAKILLEKLNEC